MSQMEKWIKKLVWLVTGVVFVFAVAAMYTSGTINLKCFYDIGKVYDVPGKELERNAANVQFLNSEDEYMTIVEESAAITFAIENYEWKFLYVYLENLSKNALTWNILCQDEAKNVVAEYQYEVTEGWNLLELTGCEFATISMRMNNQKGEHYLVKEISLREMPVIMEWNKTWKIVVVAILLYLVLSVLIGWFYRKKVGKRCISVTDIYIEFMERIRQLFYPVVAQLPGRTRRIGRTGCFLVIILYLIYVFNDAGWYTRYKQNTIVCSVLVFLVALLSIEKGIRKVHWNKPVIKSWLLFWGIVCISDFIIGKVYYAQGYVFLFVFGFTFHVWAYTKKRGELIEDFLRAIQISFWGVMLLCLLCRPDIPGVRYMGIYTNANAFAAHLVPVLIACVTIVVGKVQTGMIWYDYLFYSIEIISILFFIWKTQSRGALAVSVFVIFIVLMKIFFRRKERAVKRAAIIFGISILALTVPVLISMDWSLSNMSQKFGTQILLENDKIEEFEITDCLAMKVYAADSRIENTFRSKSWDSILSGRLTYWKTYIREMNLWGHKYKATVNGVRHDPHNMWIGIAYRYGVVGAVAFLYMWMMVIYDMYKRRRKREYGMLGLLLGLSYLILGSLDSLEQPWLYVSWFLAYFMMGICFVDKVSEYNIELYKGGKYE